jgi:hypothetical protein
MATALVDTVTQVIRDTVLVHDAIVPSFARQPDTLLVKTITSPWTPVKDVFQVLLPLATFLAGQWSASRKQARERHDAEKQLGHEISTGVSNIHAQVLAIKTEIVAGRGLQAGDLEELKRRFYGFEPVIRRLNILRDQDYATRVYTWYSQAQGTPGALQTLVGPHGDEPQEVPAFLRDMAPAHRTKRQAAEQTITLVLVEGTKLGVTIIVYHDGLALWPRMETGRYQPQMPQVDMTPVTVTPPLEREGQEPPSPQ